MKEVGFEVSTFIIGKTGEVIVIVVLEEVKVL